MTRAEYITLLDQRVRSATFIDAQGSSKDSALLGPPAVEFAPFGRTPNTKVRKDARQGTIDQDPEFIEFLESLTNPIAKATVADQDEALAKSKEKVTTTPLIQYLRDKKANKGKEPSAPAKGSKHNRQDSKDSKASTISEKKTPTKSIAASSADKRSAQAIKVENAARDAVKVLNKQATIAKKQEPPPVVKPPAAAAPASSAPLAEKKRERVNPSVAARILQRDLGLGGGPGRGGRGGRRGGSAVPSKTDTASPVPQASSPARLEPAKHNTTTPPKTLQSTAQDEASTATTPSANNNTEASKSPSAKPSSMAVPPTGPAASRNTPQTKSQVRGGNVPPAKSPAVFRGPAVSPTATQAFLKHANPSQGITEPLLEEAFSGFGTVSKVEIDKKKGFAYVDFAEPDGLQKAIQASPIKVAQGQVVVLERKVGSTLQARNARGGPTMNANRGGGVPMGPRGGRGGGTRRGGGAVRPPPKANLSTVKASQPTTVAPTQSDTAAGSSSVTATPQGTKPQPPSQSAAASTPLASPDT